MTPGRPATHSEPAGERTTADERAEVRRNGRGGAAFLLAFGLTWTLAGVSTLFLPTDIAALAFLFQGAVGTPLAFALEKVLGYPSVSRDNSLTPLAILCATSQLPMLPAAVVVYQLDPTSVPVVMAAIVGGHFLPYAWIHRSALYVVMGVAVAVVPFVLDAMTGDTAFRLIGFFVGATLLAVGSTLARRGRTGSPPVGDPRRAAGRAGS